MNKKTERVLGPNRNGPRKPSRLGNNQKTRQMLSSHLIFPALMIIASLGGAAYAQVPTVADPAKAGMQRMWPDVDGWRVLILRSDTPARAPECLFKTGYHTANTPRYHVWGLQSLQGNLSIIAATMVKEELTSARMRLTIDDTAVGTFPFAGEPDLIGGQYFTESSALNKSEASQALSLLRTAKHIRVTIGTTAFESDVTPAAFRNFEECIKHATTIK